MSWFARVRAAAGRPRRATSCSRGRGGRFTEVRTGCRARRRDAPARRRAARLRELPQPRVPPRAARSHARRRRHVLDVARADVRGRRPARPRLATSRWPARRTPRWRWPASRPSASSTTCTTARTGSRYDDPNAMAAALRRGGRRRGHPAHPARHLLPRRRNVRRGARSHPAALLGRHGRSMGGPGRRAARHRPDADRCGDPLGAGRAARRSWRPWSTLLPRRPLHVHLSEQPAENEACLARYGCTPTQLLAAEGALGTTTTAVHATHLTPDRRGAARFGTRDSVPVPYDRTRSRRRHRPVDPALRDAGAPLSLGSDQHAVIDMFEEARGLEMDERLASLRRGNFAPERAARRDDRTRLASAGRTPAGSRSARARISSRSGSTPSAPPASIRRRSCSPPLPRTSTRWSSTAARSSRAASICWAMSVRSSHRPTAVAQRDLARA